MMIDSEGTGANRRPWISIAVIRRLLGCAAISVALTAATGLLAPAGFFERLDGVVTDLAFPRSSPDPSVAVVGIDARSLVEVDPQWPWPREQYAEIVDQLSAAGAEVVVLDLILSAPTEGDAALAEAMAAMPTVLASAPASASGADGRPVAISSAAGPTEELAGRAAAIGHAQVVADAADGVVRTVPLVVEDPDRSVVPSLSLAALAVADGVEPRPVLRRPSGVQLVDRVVTTDDRYQLRVSWPEGLPPTPGVGGPVLSAADVISGDFDPASVEGRVVFVGVTDPTLGDQLATPVSKRTPDPGVMVQAAAFHTMASRQFVLGPSTSETLAWVGVLTLLVALAVQFLPMPMAVASSLLVMGVAVLVPVQRAAGGTLLHSVYPAMAVGLAIPLSGALRYAAETRLRRRVSSLFARYIPPTVAAELVRDGRIDEAVEGQRLVVTVFFCDLRGFTPLAASLEPAQVNQLLSHYYEYVSAMLFEAGGTIIQYVGDEVFAVFGAPVARSDHAEVALRCALAVQAERTRLEVLLAADDLPMVDFGIGVNSGEVVAVHAGSTFRRQYAVVGDPVNVGARLCSEARIGEVVASSATVDGVTDPPAGELYHPSLKGIDRDVVAWRFTPD